MRRKYKEIKQGLKDIKEGNTTPYKSIKEWAKEDKLWKKKHPILAKLRNTYYSIYRFFIRIGDFFLYDIKAFIQRGRRGYAERDIWDFYYYLASVISESIDNLKKQVHGHPMDLKSLKQWKTILRKISKTFKISLKKDYYQLTEKEKKEYKEGWKLFQKYFQGLWD